LHPARLRGQLHAQRQAQRQGGVEFVTLTVKAECGAVQCSCEQIQVTANI
jgi:hypothetical protein